MRKNSTRKFNVGVKAYTEKNKEMPETKCNKGSSAHRARACPASSATCD